MVSNLLVVVKFVRKALVKRSILKGSQNHFTAALTLLSFANCLSEEVE